MVSTNVNIKSNIGGSSRPSITNTRILTPDEAAARYPDQFQPGSGSGSGNDYLQRLNDLLETVTTQSTQLQQEQRTLQQQALDAQREQAQAAETAAQVDEARANQANRESYVSMLQQILLAT